LQTAAIDTAFIDPGRPLVARPVPAGGRGNAAPYSFLEGYLGIKPPWGTLDAVDMNTGDIKWRVPLGEYAELTDKGVPPTGTENYGGPVVTAGGLVFIAATADETSGRSTRTRAGGKASSRSAAPPHPVSTR
jgi:hypothetical protein